MSAVFWLFRGIDAADAGQPIEACPFDPDDSPTAFFLAHWWTKGWRRRREEVQGSHGPVE